jgi:hypothetical protein
MWPEIVHSPWSNSLVRKRCEGVSDSGHGPWPLLFHSTRVMLSGQATCHNFSNSLRRRSCKLHPSSTSSPTRRRSTSNHHRSSAEEVFEEASRSFLTPSPSALTRADVFYYRPKPQNASTESSAVCDNAEHLRSNSEKRRRLDVSDGYHCHLASCSDSMIKRKTDK